MCLITLRSTFVVFSEEHVTVKGSRVRAFTSIFAFSTRTAGNVTTVLYMVRVLNQLVPQTCHNYEV